MVDMPPCAMMARRYCMHTTLMMADLPNAAHGSACQHAAAALHQRLCSALAMTLAGIMHWLASQHCV